ncbi:hypothetical protein [Bacillus cereus]|uniref:hypothetical protein n=1 Tax=Bacillus cereus TaxID=1396 RepID=UPI00364C8451
MTQSLSQLQGIQFGFDDAHSRLIAADQPYKLENELSNCLQHLYRYMNVRHQHWGDTRRQLATRLDAVPGLNGALWIRAFDTHDVVQVGSFQDRYAEAYMNLYGGIFWLPLAAVTANTDEFDRHLDYSAHLADRDAAATVRCVFDGLAALP